MASQLLPLELIDKCVGSRIWVIMKGDKGAFDIACSCLHHLLTMPAQSSVAHYSALTTSSVRFLSLIYFDAAMLMLLPDMVLEDVTE